MRASPEQNGEATNPVRRNRSQEGLPSDFNVIVKIFVSSSV